MFSGILHHTDWQKLTANHFEMSATTHQPTFLYIPEYLNVQQFLCENIKTLNIRLQENSKFLDGRKMNLTVVIKLPAILLFSSASSSLPPCCY